MLEINQNILIAMNIFEPNSPVRRQIGIKQTNEQNPAAFCLKETHLKHKAIE